MPRKYKFCLFFYLRTPLSGAAGATAVPGSLGTLEKASRSTSCENRQLAYLHVPLRRRGARRESCGGRASTRLLATAGRSVERHRGGRCGANRIGRVTLKRTKHIEVQLANKWTR